MGVRVQGSFVGPGVKYPLKPINWAKFRERYGYRRQPSLTPPKFRPGPPLPEVPPQNGTTPDNPPG